MEFAIRFGHLVAVEIRCSSQAQFEWIAAPSLSCQLATSAISGLMGKPIQDHSSWE